MADKTSPQKDVPTTEEEVVDSKSTKSKEPIIVEEESKSENGDSTENGGSEEKENGQGEDGEDKPDAVTDDKVCSIKRKSVGGGEAETPAEGATPEKKAKLDETTEAESNGEAEVTA